MADLTGTVPARTGLGPDPAEFKRVMSRLPTGVVVVASTVDGVPHGMTVNSFTSLSLDPMLVLFGVDRRSTTWPQIRRAGRFAVSVLGAGQDEVCRTFARRGADRFGTVAWTRTASGQPILCDTVAWLDCVTTAIHPGGDHLVVIGEVHRVGERAGAVPLVFHRGQLAPLAIGGCR